MQELTCLEIAQVSGANVNLFYATAPTIGVALKGFGLCYELGLSYWSPVPMIGAVFVSSLGGAAISYVIDKDYALGSILGGTVGIFAGLYFGVDYLR